VSQGIVDLWGFAQSETERRAIKVAAETLPGVVTVNDHLTLALAFPTMTLVTAPYPTGPSNSLSKSSR
jgi:hypothetical protein